LFKIYNPATTIIKRNSAKRINPSEPKKEKQSPPARKTTKTRRSQRRKHVFLCNKSQNLATCNTRLDYICHEVQLTTKKEPT